MERLEVRFICKYWSILLLLDPDPGEPNQCESRSTTLPLTLRRRSVSLSCGEGSGFLRYGGSCLSLYEVFYVIELNFLACSAGGYCISKQGLISPAKKDSLSSCPCQALITVCCKVVNRRSGPYPGALRADPDPTK